MMNVFNNFKLHITIVVLFAILIYGLSLFLNRSKILDNQDKKFISFFIAVLDDYPNKTNFNQIIGANVVFYFPKLHFFYIYQLASDVYLEKKSSHERKDVWQPLFSQSSTKSPKILRQSYEKYSGQKIDHYLIIKKKKLLSMMELAGGCIFFNLYSTNMNYGEVILNKKNYDHFINGIQNEYYRRDTKLNVWLNQILVFLKKKSTINYNNKSTKNIYRKIQHTSLKRNDFLNLIEYLAKNLDKHYFKIFKMNIKKINHHGKTIKTIVNDHPDIEKINLEIATTLNKDNINLLKIPTIEIKNATSIKRLATKTAGVLRRKYFNVIEYSNNKFKLKNSVILKNLGTPQQENFIKKITKINTVYYMHDYKNSTDFSLYLGEDYYGSKYLQNKKSK